MATRVQEQGAWFGREPDRYVTRGAEVFRLPASGWFARCGKRVRGPLSSLDAAMAAADRMVAEEPGA